MLCEEIMKSKVHCVSLRATVEEAARIMRKEDLGFLPVCDRAGKVHGTVTDRDIAVRLVADKRPANTAVEEIMTPGVVYCSPKDDIQRAQELMAENRNSRIMCLDGGGRLVGIISLSDVAQHEHGPRVADTLRQIAEREVRV